MFDDSLSVGWFIKYENYQLLFSGNSKYFVISNPTKSPWEHAHLVFVPKTQEDLNIGLRKETLATSSWSLFLNLSRVSETWVCFPLFLRTLDFIMLRVFCPKRSVIQSLYCFCFGNSRHPFSLARPISWQKSGDKSGL